MPLPKPKKRENSSSFMSRCMSDEEMKKEFPKNKQRVAVCLSQFRQVKKSKANVSSDDFDTIKERSFFLF
tara:strand:+ start:162 stop:371 length:210 start_codon:yes stop_codon:yes gene_type:complete